MRMMIEVSLLVLVCVYSRGHAALYPDQGPTTQSSGAPQVLSQGWSPGVDKVAADSYLQALQNLQRQFKSIMMSTNEVNPPTPPSVRPAPLQWPAFPQKPYQPQQSPPPYPPPRQDPPGPAPTSALDSIFGPQIPYNPGSPQAYNPGPQQSYNPGPQQSYNPGPQQSYNPGPNTNSRAQPLQQPYWPPHQGYKRECSSGGYMPGQLCCDGIVNLIPPGGAQQWACCHKGMYDMTTQVCCGDIPIPRPPKGSPPMLCCGFSLYDPTTHLCCDSFPVPNPTRSLKCCRKQAYDPVHQMCCGEAVKPRPPGQPNMDCCGKHMFNAITHVCCDEGNPYPKSPAMACCGKKQFQPQFQQCCFGDPLPKDVYCMAK